MTMFWSRVKMGEKKKNFNRIFIGNNFRYPGYKKNNYVYFIEQIWNSLKLTIALFLLPPFYDTPS